MFFFKQENNYRSLVVGVDVKVPLPNGNYITAINFDNAATTPPFISVMQDIFTFAPYYSSIHRGNGYKSELSSNVYEKSRNTILDFVGAHPDKDTVIYVKNTTEALNKLAHRFCHGNKKCVILSSDMEHHSNDLPWRDNYTVDYINVDASGGLSLKALEEKLIKYKGNVKLVTVTGASNVTGIINPIYKIAALTHSYGAKIVVDGAQLIPHIPFNMRPSNPKEHIDYLVFSGHKMYAPFGVGVLIGSKSDFENGPPDLKGGGTVQFVTHDYVGWNSPPQKEEAGTPNLMGVIALVSAIETLRSVNMHEIAKIEGSLTQYTLNKIKKIPDIILYGNQNYTEDRLGIIPFNIEGIPHNVTASILSSERGISVRSGCFCAHPYVQQLLKLSPKELTKYIQNPNLPRPGMVRISFGLYNTPYEVDVLIDLLLRIVKNKSYYLQKYNTN